MKKHKAFIFIIILVVLTGAAAVWHLATREEVPEHCVAVSYKDDIVYVDLDTLAYEHVSGVRINGKGEEKPVEGQGILLKDVLEQYEINSFETIAVVSDDSYTAEVNSMEVLEDEKVYLMYEEEELRLVVFGDTDSKRSVSNVVKIEVK